jgi:twitching motility protein PilT
MLAYAEKNMLMELSEALDLVQQARGSDLLISAYTPARLRRDGELLLLDQRPLTPADTELMLRSVLTVEQWHELEQQRHVDFAFTWRDAARIRGNAYFQRDSVAAAFRLLPLQIPSMEELGIPQSVRELIWQRQGLILVTGPTGSGKSTTLAAMVDYVNQTRACHIVTVEDPIEYVHQHKLALVDQRQVGADTHSFKEALRAVFREDPDVVLIGEMRDLETISAALTIAETGHMVLATLHTNDAAQAIDRILDGFPPGLQQQARIQLSASLTGVIYQQLLTGVEGGRVAAFEVLVANHAVRALIKEQKTNQLRNVIQTSMREGSQTLEWSLSQLVQEGLVTVREAQAKSLYPQEVSA